MGDALIRKAQTKRPKEVICCSPVGICRRDGGGKEGEEGSAAGRAPHPDPRPSASAPAPQHLQCGQRIKMGMEHIMQTCER